MKYEDNPILVIHPLANDWTSFTNIVCEPYVSFPSWPTGGHINVDFELIMCLANNYRSLSSDFKPLDIIWTREAHPVTGIIFSHVGIYLGNDEVIDFSKEGVRKVSWNNFSSFGRVVGFHPIIPFKNYKDIIRQAVWAKDNDFRRGNYNLANRNCEHFANMLVYGIDFSQQIHENYVGLQSRAAVQAAGIGAFGGVTTTGSILLAPFTGGLSLIAGAASVGVTAAMLVDNKENHCDNNNEKKTVCLRNEIKNVDNRLGKKSDWETEKFEKEYEARIEQPTNIKDCIIM